MNRLELKSLLTDRGVATPSARIVRALSERGTLRAPQLVSLTCLAKSPASTTLSELRKSGMVVESPPAETARACRPTRDGR